MQSKTVRTFVRVKHSDTNPHGVVRRSKYWDYFEAAENDFYHAIGRLERENYHDFGLPRVAARLHHLAPAYLDDLLEVSVHVDRITRRTFTYGIRITRRDPVESDTAAVIAEGALTICCVDREGNSRDLPSDLVEYMKAYQPATSEK